MMMIAKIAGKLIENLHMSNTILTHQSPTKRYYYFLHFRDEELRNHLRSQRADRAETKSVLLTSPQITEPAPD